MKLNIDTIWQEAFNQRCCKYQIKNILLCDACSCVYLLFGGKELRITVNSRMYNFSKILETKQYKHVAKIYECFKMSLPNQYGEEEPVFCIVTEHLKRDFQPRVVIQSAINLFRNVWSDYLNKQHRLEINPDVSIEKAYAEKDIEGRKYVLEQINLSGHSPIIIEIANALNDTYRKIKELDSDSTLYLFTDNIGLADDSLIKLCNIGHDYIGLGDNYEIDLTRRSITIKYNPIITEDFVIDNRMLIPLKVNFGDGNFSPVLGQIDTGANTSGFTEALFNRASLINLGETKTSGVTGTMNSIRTECQVIFPNGYEATLYGTTMRDFDDVSILIGMDLLSKCKFQSEPYGNGFKYKLTF